MRDWASSVPRGMVFSQEGERKQPPNPLIVQSVPRARGQSHSDWTGRRKWGGREGGPRWKQKHSVLYGTNPSSKGFAWPKLTLYLLACIIDVLHLFPATNLQGLGQCCGTTVPGYMNQQLSVEAEGNMAALLHHYHTCIFPVWSKLPFLLPCLPSFAYCQLCFWRP